MKFWFVRPCILIFDSLAGASRSRVVATLRDYLRVEYEAKHGETRDFSGDVMKGSNVRCPQQTNYTDCGLYVLQYVEAFFQVCMTMNVQIIKPYHAQIKNKFNIYFNSQTVTVLSWRNLADSQPVIISQFNHYLRIFNWVGLYCLTGDSPFLCLQKILSKTSGQIKNIFSPTSVILL